MRVYIVCGAIALTLTKFNESASPSSEAPEAQPHLQQTRRTNSMQATTFTGS